MRHRPLFVLLVLALPGLSSCAPPKVYEDPVPVMTSHAQGPDERMAAGVQANGDPAFHNDPRRIAALNRILWVPGFASQERNAAIDQLADYDEAAFKAQAARRIVLIRQWDVLQHLMDVAVKRHWTDFIPAIVRSYSRPARASGDAVRPEVGALQALSPGKSVEEIIFGVFADTGGKLAPDEQTAAWELLCREATAPRIMDLLARAPDQTPLVVDLKAAAADLKTLPTNREDILRLEYLRDPGRKAFWEAAKARVAVLKPEQREGLELRHLPVLLNLDPSVLAMDKSALYRAVAEVVGPGEHHFRDSVAGPVARADRQALSDARDKLCWADLATIWFVCKVLRDDGASAAFFAQADADKEDTATEYGGVLTFANGHFIPRLCKPEIVGNDHKFVAPPEMMLALYTGIAHYHFHAQQYENGEYAGPGSGDLDLADRIRANCIVLTFIDRQRLNVDYYQAGNVVVDLGTFHR